jgi:dephospho-CoA kinase
MIRVLVTGISGVGKSTLITKLASLGYKAVDLDTEEWSHWTAADPHEDHSITGTPVEAERDWVWREDRVHALMATDDANVLFVSGCASNMGIFRPMFDHVVLLTAPPKVIAQRLATRTANTYGKRPEEIARVLALIDTVEILLRRSADEVIDTTVPLSEVLIRVRNLAQTPRKSGSPRK